MALSHCDVRMRSADSARASGIKDPKERTDARGMRIKLGDRSSCDLQLSLLIHCVVIIVIVDKTNVKRDGRGREEENESSNKVAFGLP